MSSVSWSQVLYFGPIRCGMLLANTLNWKWKHLIGLFWTWQTECFSNHPQRSFLKAPPLYQYFLCTVSPMGMGNKSDLRNIPSDRASFTSVCVTRQVRTWEARHTHRQTSLSFPTCSSLFTPSPQCWRIVISCLLKTLDPSLRLCVCLYVRVCVFPDMNVGNVRTNAAREWNEMHCERMCSGRACSSQVGGQRMYQSLIIFTRVRADTLCSKLCALCLSILVIICLPASLLVALGNAHLSLG